MNYTDLHNKLKTLFDPNKSEIELPGGIKICNVEFLSDYPDENFINPEDPGIRENINFLYPVFCPKGESKRAILLLHGLNERSWTKYLVWAHQLAERTSSYVILFPISFHINRSPERWSNPRSMVDYLNQRNTQIGSISQSSFANIALSNRLTDDPMRFFNSGYQTTNDIIKLLSIIRNGTHPTIPKACRIDIFAYSIGAFLSEILMMGNPSNLFSESKLFIFCGGSVFSNMNGSSKLIMDKRAFERVYDYFLNDFENRIEEKSMLSEFFQTSKIGISFRSMIDLDRLIPFRENLFSKLRDQISAIALEKDTVIPLPGVINTLKATGKKNTIRKMDFNYPYSHENPFPILNSQLKSEVDKSFDQVFNIAAAFLG